MPDECTITLDREGAKWLREQMQDAMANGEIAVAKHGELGFIVESMAYANDVLCQLETYFEE